MLGFSSFWGAPVSAKTPSPQSVAPRRFSPPTLKISGSAQKFLAQKPVLTSLDIDSTLIPWLKEPEYDEVALTRYRKTLGSPDFRNQSFVILNTGRSLSAVKRLAPILRDLPIDALGLNDGQQLYLRSASLDKNAHPKNDSQSWLQSLSRSDQDPHWKAVLGGWSATQVLQDIRDTLQTDLGFQLAAKPGEKNRFNPNGEYFAFQKPMSPKHPKSGDWVIRICPDQTYFEVASTQPDVTEPDIANYSEFLIDHLQARLKPQWPTVMFYNSQSSEGCHIHLGPENTNKASLVRHLLATRFEQKPQAVISAGDNTNDIALLSSHTLEGVPNYPVLVGSHPKVMAALRQNPPPNLESVGWNQLDEGLKKQFAKVKDHLKTTGGNGQRLDATA
ncbi:HAD hydrolase family protein [Vampirovibrio sp.]|uniref:HAD hydrolase family protein n=1 Tax=Vampirovibrio sp. TaxID=2717857 RepID=UPI0035947E04